MREERLDDFLKQYPAGTPWDNSTTYGTYGNYGGCAAYAFQAQHIVFGTDNYKDYVWSNDIADIRPYSIVRYGGATTSSHWAFILSVDNIERNRRGDVESVTVTVAEGNYNSQVNIGRTLILSSGMGRCIFLELWNYAE